MSTSTRENSCNLSSPKAAATVPAKAVCPSCTVLASKVDLRTVRSLVVSEKRDEIGEEQHYFCAESGCAVVYFTFDSGRRFLRSELSVRVGVKETEDPIPVCYCFGHTRGSIAKEIADSGSTKVVEEIRAEIAAERCVCETQNPSGKCCLGEVISTVRELQAIDVNDSSASEVPPTCEC